MLVFFGPRGKRQGERVCVGCVGGDDDDHWGWCLVWWWFWGLVVKGGVNTKHTDTLRLAHAHTLGRRVGHHGASCIGAEKPD